ncbi:MAG TPA: LysE family transporter [Cyclobacteriaceae bacterium]|nr:LysE family transporter [Cyclobacteriaceae bacterium]
MIVIKGIQFGIVLALLVGPVFFAIIQTSAERGFAKGVLVAIGVSISDAFYIVVCYLGLIQLIESPVFRDQMAYVGGAILIIFGLYHLIVKTRKSFTPKKVATESNSYRYILKGFFINAFSPMVPILWIGYVSVASIDLGLVTDSEFTVFFLSMLATVFLTDIAKAYLAGRMSTLVTPYRMMWMNIIVGVALFVYGGRLILTGLHYI